MYYVMSAAAVAKSKLYIPVGCDVRSGNPHPPQGVSRGVVRIKCIIDGLWYRFYFGVENEILAQ